MPPRVILRGRQPNECAEAYEEEQWDKSLVGQNDSTRDGCAHGNPDHVTVVLYRTASPFLVAGLNLHSFAPLNSIMSGMR